MSMAMPAPSGDQLISSSRDHCRRTGRPGTARASSTASNATSSAPFWPKQPAPSMCSTTMLSGGRDRATRQVGAQIEDALGVRPHLERGLAPARHGAGRRHRGVREEGPRVAVAHGAGDGGRAWRPRACRRWSSRRGGCAASRRAASRPAARSPRSIARPRAARATAVDGRLLGLGDDADEAAVAHHRHDARHPLRGRGVEREQLGARRGRPQHAAVQQAVERAIVDEARPAEHLVGDVEARNALPGQLPRRDRLGGNAGAGVARQQRIVGQLPVAGAQVAWPDDGAVAHLQRAGGHAQPLGRDGRDRWRAPRRTRAAAPCRNRAPTGCPR